MSSKNQKEKYVCLMSWSFFSFDSWSRRQDVVTHPRSEKNWYVKIDTEVSVLSGDYEQEWINVFKLTSKCMGFLKWVDSCRETNHCSYWTCYYFTKHILPLVVCLIATWPGFGFCFIWVPSEGKIFPVLKDGTCSNQMQPSHGGGKWTQPN